MPGFSELLERVETDRAWCDRFRSNYGRAGRLATDLPLIHMTDRTEELISEAVTNVRGGLTIPEAGGALPEIAEVRPIDPGYETTTVQVEKQSDIPRSAYFAVGRAYNFSLGGQDDVVFAFEPGCECEADGEASPFDSGHLLSAEHPVVPTPSHRDVQSLFQAWRITGIENVRKWLGVFLAAYFDDPLAYLNLVERPHPLDPSGPIQFVNPDPDRDSNAWLHWTFEVRLHSRGLGLGKVVKWAARPDTVTRIRSLILRCKGKMRNDVYTSLQVFMSKLLKPPSHRPVDQINEWIQNRARRGAP